MGGQKALMKALYVDYDSKTKIIDIIDGMLSIGNILEADTLKIISDAFGFNIVFNAKAESEGYKKNKIIVCDDGEQSIYGPFIIVGANSSNIMYGLSEEQLNWLIEKFNADKVDIRTRRSRC